MFISSVVHLNPNFRFLFNHRKKRKRTQFKYLKGCSCSFHRSLLTGLFPPSSGTIEVYGRDMQANLDDIRKELGVCMQYDVLFDHMTAKEHLLLYGQIKAPHWSQKQLHEQVRS